jgi:hypothetical protein
MRLGIRLLLAVATLVLVLMLAVVLVARQQLSAAGIDQLAWSGPGWSAGALRVESLSGRYITEGGARLNVSISGLSVDPVWSGRPRLDTVRASQVQLDWQPSFKAQQQAASAMPDLRALADSLQWLPFSLLALPNIDIHLPCSTSFCDLSTGLQITRLEVGIFALQAELLAAEGSITLDGILNTDEAGLEADINLGLSGQPAAQLQTRWLYGESVPRSSGALTVADWPQADWLLAYLQPWFSGAQLPVDALPTGLSVNLNWFLEPVERPESFAGMLDGAVEVRAEVALASAWRIPRVGTAEGEMTLDLLGDAGLWQLSEGQLRLRLSEPTLPSLVALPDQTRPIALEIDVRAREASQLAWSSSLPLQLNVQVEGPVIGSVSGALVVTSGSGWQAEWDGMRLRAGIDRYALGALQLRKVEIDWPLAGRVDGQQLILELGSGAVMSLGSVQAEPDLVMKNVRADLAGLALMLPLGQPAGIAASGPLTLSAAEVEHRLLHPQAWVLQGRLERDGSVLRWKGRLASASELAVGLVFAWPTGQSWRADMTLEPTFLRGGDPLSTMLRSWPELLTVSSGRLQGQVSLHGTGTLNKVDGRLELSGAAGIYDRASFEGLTAAVDIDLAGDRVQLRMPALTLDSLNPGLPMGPLSAQLGYAASMARPAAGKLTVDQARMDVMGGQISLDSGVLDLAAARHEMVLTIRGVRLDRLFEAYPAEGLRGFGTLDGRLPLTLAGGELVISEGEVDARKPGGFLQYRSGKLESLATSTPGMRQVVQALDDFQYDLLSADVTYGEGGILILGLELQGRNPAVEEGRPIHLNIRLEEDVPALMASLQLSGQVSEVIQKRIQQRLLQRRMEP